MKFLLERFRLEKIKKHGIRFAFSKQYRKECNASDRKKRRNSGLGQLRDNRRKRKVKQSLFIRDGNKCFWCGENITVKTSTIDHVIPIKFGGKSKQYNLQLIHCNCRVDRDKLFRIIYGL